MSHGSPITATDLWTVAQTAWGEARGEPIEGRYAVIWTIRNRQSLHRRWRSMPLVAICRAPWQYSVWNPKDPNLPHIQNVSLEDAVFCECLQIAIEVLGGQSISPVGRATHYHTAAIACPNWAKGHTSVCQIGGHLYYEDIA